MQYNSSQIIDDLMVEQGLTQAQLAKLVDISQSTISRLRRDGEYERNGAARLKLLRYIKARQPDADVLGEYGPKRVAKTFERFWDGSPDHTEAIVKILRALAGLRPIANPREGGLRERKRKSPPTTLKKHRA